MILKQMEKKNDNDKTQNELDMTRERLLPPQVYTKHVSSPVDLNVQNVYFHDVEDEPEIMK